MAARNAGTPGYISSHARHNKLIDRQRKQMISYQAALTQWSRETCKLYTPLHSSLELERLDSLQESGLPGPAVKSLLSAYLPCPMLY